MSCGCLTCPGGRDVMGVFNRSKLVGLQGTSSVPEGFIGARRVHRCPKGSSVPEGFIGARRVHKREGPEGPRKLRKATRTPGERGPDPLNLYEFTQTTHT